MVNKRRETEKSLKDVDTVRADEEESQLKTTSVTATLTHCKN